MILAFQPSSGSKITPNLCLKKYQSVNQSRIKSDDRFERRNTDNTSFQKGSYLNCQHPIFKIFANLGAIALNVSILAMLVTLMFCGFTNIDPRSLLPNVFR